MIEPEVPLHPITGEPLTPPPDEPDEESTGWPTRLLRGWSKPKGVSAPSDPEQADSEPDDGEAAAEPARSRRLMGALRRILRRGAPALPSMADGDEHDAGLSDDPELESLDEAPERRWKLNRTGRIGLAVGISAVVLGSVGIAKLAHREPTSGSTATQEADQSRSLQSATENPAPPSNGTQSQKPAATVADLSEAPPPLPDDSTFVPATDPVQSVLAPEQAAPLPVDALPPGALDTQRSEQNIEPPALPAPIDDLPGAAHPTLDAVPPSVVLTDAPPAAGDPEMELPTLTGVGPEETTPSLLAETEPLGASSLADAPTPENPTRISEPADVSRLRSDPIASDTPEPLLGSSAVPSSAGGQRTPIGGVVPALAGSDSTALPPGSEEAPPGATPRIDEGTDAPGTLADRRTGAPRPQASSDSRYPTAEERAQWIPIPNASSERKITRASVSSESVQGVLSPTGRPSLPAGWKRHIVQRQENFWTISRTYYGSGRYYKALWQANRDHVPLIDELYIGTELMIPPVGELPNDPSVDRSARVDPSVQRRSATEQDLEADGSGRSGDAERAVFERVEDRTADVARSSRGPGKSFGQVHVVKANETLRSIARLRLGDPDRANEIYELNARKIRNPRQLQPNTVLQLPE